MAGVKEVLEKWYGRMGADRPEEGWPKQEDFSLPTDIYESSEVQSAMNYPGAPPGLKAAPAIGAMLAPEIEGVARTATQAFHNADPVFMQRLQTLLKEIPSEKLDSAVKWLHTVSKEAMPNLLPGKLGRAFGTAAAPTSATSQSIERQGAKGGMLPEAIAKLRRDMATGPGAMTHSPGVMNQHSNAVAEYFDTLIHEIIHLIGAKAGKRWTQTEEGFVGPAARAIVQGKPSPYVKDLIEQLSIEEQTTRLLYPK